MFNVKLTFTKTLYVAISFSVSLVILQAINKTLFNFLQKPYLYIKNDERVNSENMWQVMLRDEKNKNLALRKQLILNNECRKVLNSMSSSYQYITTGASIFFSKGSNKFIIATTNSSNVKLNDVAINKNDYIIGRIVDVLSDGMLKIQQIEDDKAYIPSVILEHSLSGYVNGYNDAECSVVFETDETFDLSKINDGDIVVTSGFDNFIPYGMNVGRIKKYKGKLCIDRDIDRYTNIFKIVRAKPHI